jgi:hypothetical protein
MILLGALLMIPTALSGVYAARDVISDDPGQTWREMQETSRLSPIQWEFLRDHVIQNVVATALAVLAVFLWIASSDTWRRRLHFPLLLALLLGLGFLVAGAWHGGEMVYRYATAIEGREVPTAAEHPARPEAAAPEGHTRAVPTIEQFLPPMQLHVVAAGSVIAVALAAMALSIRGIKGVPTVETANVNEERWEQTQEDLDGIRRAFASDPAPAQATVPKAVALPERVPSSRFWILAALLGLATAAGGLWVGGIGSWELFVNTVRNDENRRDTAHIIFGVSIVVLTLILAAVTRWGTRRKLFMSLFSLLLLLAVAGQVWLGVLLMYDTPVGPLTGFNPQTASMMKPTSTPTTAPATDPR